MPTRRCMQHCLDFDPKSLEAYLMSHSDHERRRFALQAALLNPLTDGFLRRPEFSREC